MLGGRFIVSCFYVLLRMAIASSGNRGRFDCGPDRLFAGRIFASWTRSSEPEAGAATAGARVRAVFAVVFFVVVVVGIGGCAGCGESIRLHTVNELEGMCVGLRRAKDILIYFSCPIYKCQIGRGEGTRRTCLSIQIQIGVLSCSDRRVSIGRSRVISRRVHEVWLINNTPRGTPS